MLERHPQCICGPWSAGSPQVLWRLWAKPISNFLKVFKTWKCCVYIYIYMYIYIYIYIYILYIYIYKKNLANRMLHTMRLLRVHHIHHVPNRSSYFCKIWALCVSQNFITSGTCFLIPNDVRSISRSSLIKHH